MRKKKRAREAEEKEKEAIAKKRYTEKEEDWQTSWQKGSQKRSHHDDSTCSSDGAALAHRDLWDVDGAAQTPSNVSHTTADRKTQMRS